ncbi:MAG: TonB-dependent receptor plug domain-containing protein [Bacteroidia bacterium]
MVQIYTFILIIFLILSGYLSYSQQYVQHFDTVTIVSVRIPQKIYQTGRHILIIESEQINKLPVSNLDELLRYLPGIEVQSRGSFGVQSDIILRGSTFSQVLVMLDGVRLNDPLTAHFNSNIPISLSEIDRIEVIHGPASAMYGADAMGGVINIISKTFSRIHLNDQFNTDFELKFGEFNYTGTNAGFFYKKNKIRAGFGITTNESDGQQLPSGLYSFFNNKTASGSFSFPLSGKMHLMLRSGYDNRDFNAQYFYTRSIFDLSEEKITGIWNQSKLIYSGDKSKIWIDAAFKYNEDWFLFNPAFPPANQHITKQFTIKANHLRSLSEKIDFIAGIQTGEKYIRSNDRGNHSNNNYAVYTQFNYKPITKLNIGTSLRADYDENYGTELLPQLSTSYHIDKFTVRIAGGRSIRAADYTERFISTNLKGPLPAGRNIGNPDLLAESAWSAETGFDYYPANGIKLSATGFYRKGSNVIDYVTTPYQSIPNNNNLTSGASYFYPKNIAEVLTSGVQIESWFTFIPATNQKLEFILGYNYISVETGEDIQGAKYLTSQAKNLLTGNIIYQNSIFNLALNGLWKERTREAASSIDSELNTSYYIINSRLDLNIFQSKFFISGEVLNLTNTQYADILGAKMPDRWITAGIRYKNDFKF